jgi:hypothetical protein
MGIRGICVPFFSFLESLQHINVTSPIQFCYDMRWETADKRQEIQPMS